jgi:hypothetical protein
VFGQWSEPKAQGSKEKALSLHPADALFFVEY